MSPPTLRERFILEDAARFGHESPLHDVVNDVSALVRSGHAAYNAGMSGDAQLYWRCAARIAAAALEQQAEEENVPEHRTWCDAVSKEARWDCNCGLAERRSLAALEQQGEN